MIRPHLTFPRPTLSFSFAAPQLTPFAATLASSMQITDKSATLTPAFATLTSPVKHKSCVCHSCKKHPGCRVPIVNCFVALTSVCVPLGHLTPATFETEQPQDFKNHAVLPAPDRKSPVSALVLSLPPLASHQSRVTKSFTTLRLRAVSARRIRTFAKCTRNFFTMNTSKTEDLKLFRMNTYKKSGGGGPTSSTQGVFGEVPLRARVLRLRRVQEFSNA